MRSESNRHTPPHCFCSLPTILRAECHGTVYKCQANILNPPPVDNSQVDNDRDNSSNSIRLQLGSRLVSTSTQPGSPRRNTSARKEFKPPDRPSPATIAAIQDIATVLTSFGKTLAPRSPGLAKTLLKDNTNNASGSNSDGSNLGTHSYTHQLHPQQQQQLTIPVPSPTPSKPRPIGVCGFHVHTSTWEKFKLQLLQAEIVTTGGGSSLCRSSQGPEREKAFAEGHHQLVLRHRYLHDGFIQQARVDGCKSQMATVAQWTAWEQEIVERGLSSSGGIAATPTCFCGHRMRLSYLYNGQGPQMSYVCALRIQDVQRGCSRVISSAKWAVRKKPVFTQTILSEVEPPTAKMQPRREEFAQRTSIAIGSAVTRRTDKENNNVIDSQHISSRAAVASVLDHKLQSNDDSLRDSRQDSGIEVDENDPEEDEYDGSEPNWSLSTGWCLNASLRHKMRPLPLSTSLLKKSDWTTDLKAQRRSDQQEGVKRELYNHSDSKRDYGGHYGHQRKIYDNSSETDFSMRSVQSRSTADIRSLSVAQMRSIYLSLETPKEYSPLMQRLHESKLLATERERSAKAIQRSETRLRDWEESIERLGEYVKELCQDGLDNNTLLCRSCGNGTFLHANVPCYHLVMCDDCIKKYQRCVVCSTKIESSQRIYW